jgi:hypothetical protein
MTCKHEEGKPGCQTHLFKVREAEAFLAREEKRKQERGEMSSTPDSKKFRIESITRHFNYLLLEVSYPNCAKCSYEGRKLLVYYKVNEIDIHQWDEIDPHFREPVLQSLRVAPPPIARFPASDEGRSDARLFMQLRHETRP